MKKYLVPGVYDFLHKGHQNLIDHAMKEGIASVALINDYGVELKGKKGVSPYSKRFDAIKNFYNNIEVFETDSTYESYLDLYNKHSFDAILFGSDHKDTIKTKRLKEAGVNVIIVPRTKGISSTQIRKSLNSK